MGMAAAVMLVALVGGLVVGLVLVHHPQNGAAPTATPETTAAPTPTQKPTAPPQNLYAILDGNTVVALNPADGTVKWRYPFSGASEALPPSLTVMNNTVYLWVSQNLVALNASDGTQRWEAKNVGVTGFIWMTKELVFTLPSPTSSGVTLIALNVSDGTVRWSSQQPIHPMDVTANGDAVYVQTQLPATLFVLNVSNGKERWHFGVANSIESVTGDGDTVYVTSGLPETLWALNANNGNVRWHASATDATKFITPTVVNGVVYAPLDGYIQSGGGPAILYALQASDGKELWHSPQAQAGIYYSTPAVSDGVVYTADQQYVYAFNAENGQMRWNSNVGPIYEPAAPIVMNGLIYVESGLGGGSGTLATVIHALNPADGKEVWNFHQELPVDGFPGPLIPLVTNGLVYAYGPSGGAVALDASTGKQLWQNNSNLSDLVIG
jgi:outer membrane protein assembly factor BamB